jgi:histidine triad (HIT) family protein
MDQEHCIFCKIIAGQAPARVIYRDDQAIAFWDAHPIAPIHILIVPVRHIESLKTAGSDDEGLIGHLALVARQLAEQNGVAQTGYRLVINTGPHAGQSVFHLHLHLIGGRHLPFRFE